MDIFGISSCIKSCINSCINSIISTMTSVVFIATQVLLKKDGDTNV